MTGVTQIPTVVAVVTEHVAALRAEPAGQTALRIDADLSSELGLDSLQILRLCMEIEQQFGLAAGHLGVAQSATIRALAVDVCELLEQRGAGAARC